MFLVRVEVAVLVSLICLIPFYLAKSDDRDNILVHEADILTRSDEWRSKEDKLFHDSGICGKRNRSYAETCPNIKLTNSCPRNCELDALRHANCFCDDACHIYHDCCINYVLETDHFSRIWNCRDVTGKTGFKYPIYVLQTCPDEWEDAYTRSMCEIEASEKDKNGQQFSYMQDIPVKSETNGLFYRNIFCALCNGEHSLVKWKFYYYCAGAVMKLHEENEIDFSRSYYHTRTGSFKNVKVGEIFTNCRIIVENFELTRILYEYGARLCKPIISTCAVEFEEASQQRCNSYASFVYQNAYPSNTRKVFKNFHCALCNKVDIDKLTCSDPLLPPLRVETLPPSSLSFLFDFNFGGGQNQVGSINPCKIKDGMIWDPVLKKCENFTCGILFERRGSLCFPHVTDDELNGLNNSCRKRILSKNVFQIYEDGRVFINDSGKILSRSEYEANEMDGANIISIAVCLDEGSFLLYFSKAQYYLSEVTLSLSIICLIFHLFVYAALKELRNCPGKILMSLSACLLCGNSFLLVGPHIRSLDAMCYTCSVLTHFGYLSAFMWMNVMGYDIYRTFSTTRRRTSTKKKLFVKYSLYCWLTSLTITFVSVLFDKTSSISNDFRPKYGNPICWFNQRKGLLVFFILPIFILLLMNVIFFTICAFRIRKVSNETKMVNNLSDRVRYFLYIKLSIVFGLTWLLGFLAGMVNVEFLWYLFIIFNGLQGVFIFIAFTIKRKTIKMLLVKFKFHSASYKMDKPSGVKHTMYSSLSNLSTLQTTLTAHLPALSENSNILKAVRKLNPDDMIDKT